MSNLKQKSKNLKVVGFCGQSGAGKTTIIRKLPEVDGKRFIRNTGIIRYLFSKNNGPHTTNNSYVSPRDILDIYNKLGDATPNQKVNELYERYIRSQMQLMNDFSSEVFYASREAHIEETYLFTDRTPLDFAILTECGIKQLQSIMGGELNSHHKRLIELCRSTALKNTKQFFDGVFVTKPWLGDDTEVLTDGVRDQYLSEYYTGDNWYSNVKGIDESVTKIFTITEDIVSLEDRASYVCSKLSEV
jgi:hypothetical protein